MANKKIAEYWKKTQIKKWEVRNKTWQPRKWISLFLHQCKEDGIEQPTKNDIEATYLSLINLQDDWLIKAKNDPVQPIIVRKLADFIINSKDIWIFETMLDRAHWKAMQREELKSEWESAKKEFYDSLKNKVNTMNPNELNSTIQDLLK